MATHLWPGTLLPAEPASRSVRGSARSSSLEDKCTAGAHTSRRVEHSLGTAGTKPCNAQGDRVSSRSAYRRSQRAPAGKHAAAGSPPLLWYQHPQLAQGQGLERHPSLQPGCDRSAHVTVAEVTSGVIVWSNGIRRHKKGGMLTASSATNAVRRVRGSRVHACTVIRVQTAACLTNLQSSKSSSSVGPIRAAPVLMPDH